VLLVGPCGFPWTHRRDTSIPLLQPTSRSRAPAVKTPSSETARRAPWEKPADVPLRDPPRTQRYRRFRSRKTPDHLAVIRPPTAPCLTARRRLRVEGLFAPFRFRGRRFEGRGSFIGCSAPRRSKPSDASGRLKTGTLARSHPPPLIPFHGCTSMLPLPEIEAPFVEEVQSERPLELPPGALCPLADGRSRCTCSSMFENVD